MRNATNMLKINKWKTDRKWVFSQDKGIFHWQDIIFVQDKLSFVTLGLVMSVFELDF